MRTLTKFIEDNNRWITIFGNSAITFPLSEQDVAELARTIDSQLSPENLMCDGEISHAEAQRKYRFLATVAQELDHYCRQQGIDSPEIYEL